MHAVAAEAAREKSHCLHVAEPKPPRLLVGIAPGEAVRIAEQRAAQAVDATGRALRGDALVFAAGVASFPHPWRELAGDPALRRTLRCWLRGMIRFLRGEHGATLQYVLLHLDEPYPHLHWAAVPELEPGHRMRGETVHPGKAAFSKAKAAGQNNAAARRAYCLAMSGWLDRVHAAAYAPQGFSRIGPRRQRLTQAERRARERDHAALARTREREQELKARWRADVVREVGAEHSVELTRLEAQRHLAAARADAAEAALAGALEAQARLRDELVALRATALPQHRSRPKRGRRARGRSGRRAGPRRGRRSMALFRNGDAAAAAGRPTRNVGARRW